MQLSSEIYVSIFGSHGTYEVTNRHQPSHYESWCKTEVCRRRKYRFLGLLDHRKYSSALETSS